MAVDTARTRRVVGVFPGREAADAAFTELRDGVVSSEHVVLLAPEPPGGGRSAEAGATLGTLVGGTVGLTGALAAAVVSVPGLGMVAAIGMAGAAILGVGGATAGAAYGADAEPWSGIDAAEVVVYEDALRRRGVVVVASAVSEEQAEAARAVMLRHGGQDYAAARDQWWRGVSQSEAEPGPTAMDEPAFRRGFESALREGAHGRRADEVLSALQRGSPDPPDPDAFHAGFSRGLEYRRAWEHARSRPQDAALVGTRAPGP